MNWYLAVLKNYAGFSGRARRREYWMFALFNLIFLIVAMILDNVLGTAIEGIGYGLFYFLYTLAVLIPGLAVSVRRLHDIGKSGWMILIVLIPIIGWIWLLVLMFIDSKPGKKSIWSQSERNTCQLKSISQSWLTHTLNRYYVSFWFYRLIPAVNSECKRVLSSPSHEVYFCACVRLTAVC